MMEEKIRENKENQSQNPEKFVYKMAERIGRLYFGNSEGRIS